MTGATVASIDLIQFAEAIKSQGTGTSKYGSSTNICGLQLCSEIPGGKAAWMEQQKMPTPVAPVTEESMMEEEPAMKDQTISTTKYPFSRSIVGGSCMYFKTNDEIV